MVRAAKALLGVALGALIVAFALGPAIGGKQTSAVPTVAATATPAVSCIPTPNLAVPGYLKPIIDPDFGSTITRITNVPGLRHAYARIQPWNADGTKLLMDFTPSSAHMLDGNTYADLGSYSPVPFALWSNVDPKTLYGAQGRSLVRQDAVTGAVTAIKTYAGNVSIGDYEGGLADDDSTMVLTENGRMLTVVPATGVVLGDVPAPSMDNVQISRSGNYAVVVGGNTYRLTSQLGEPITLYPYANHGDNWLADGTDYFVANSTGSGVEAFRLLDGRATTLIPQGSAFEYGHASGRGADVVLSVYDTRVTAGEPGCDEIVTVGLQGVTRVWAHAHHTRAQDGSAAAYISQPQAVPSRDGKRILFASDWGRANIYDYVVQ